MNTSDELKLLKEKYQSEANAQKQPLYTSIHEIENDTATKVAEIDAEIALIDTAYKTKADIKKKIKLGIFTRTDYDALSDSDKQLAVDGLFEIYSEEKVNVYKSSSALEFMDISIAKLLLVTMDRTKLNPQQLEFLNIFETIVNIHPMTIDKVDWEIQYVQSIMTSILQNRVEYAQKKIEMTGSF